MTEYVVGPQGPPVGSLYPNVSDLPLNTYMKIIPFQLWLESWDLPEPLDLQRLPPQIASQVDWSKCWSSICGSYCWMWKGSKDKKGYGLIAWPKLGTYSNGAPRRVPVHRVVYLELIGDIPPMYWVDHICRVSGCCNPNHLRLASSKQNAENKKLSTLNTSGVPGVTWRKDQNMWRARIGHNSKRYHLGDFQSIDEAREVYYYVKNKIHTHGEKYTIDESVISEDGWIGIVRVLNKLEVIDD